MKHSSRAFARTLSLAAAAVAGLLLAGGCKEAEQHEASRALPGLGAKTDETSVSGISSGAYMAGQFQMAHAKRVTGAAIIAGGPYGCSESIFAGTMPGAGTAFLNLSKAVNGCMLDLLGVWGVAIRRSSQGKPKSARRRARSIRSPTWSATASICSPARKIIP